MLRRRWLFLIYLCALTLSLAAVTSRPGAYQKSNAIRGAAHFPALDRGRPFDVAATIGAIPYQPGVVGSVLPQQKYLQTIEGGLGNCSQKAFGLAWQLGREGREYQVVHLLPLDSFLDGGGHTLLRTEVTWEGRDAVGVVDMLQGALPLTRGRLVDLPDLVAGPIEEFRFALLNPGGEDSIEYYGEFLDTAVVGVISTAAIARYFRFLERVYVPLGNERLEKLVFDGLAIVMGFYPAIDVVEVDRLFAGRRLERAGYRTALWVFRSAIVIFPLFVGLELLARRERN